MIEVTSDTDMQRFGSQLGGLLVGGEVIELVGDVGAGKTTLVRGIAKGMGVSEAVASPSFTISRVYDADAGRQLVHYDFYRLTDPGIMGNELAETAGGDDAVTVIEWADAVEQVLPKDRLTITIEPKGENERRLALSGGGAVSQKLVEQLT